MSFVRGENIFLCCLLQSAEKLSGEIVNAILTLGLQEKVLYFFVRKFSTKPVSVVDSVTSFRLCFYSHKI